MPSGKFSKVSVGERIGCLEVRSFARQDGVVRVVCHCHACGSCGYTNTYNEVWRNQRRAAKRGRDFTCGCGTASALSESKIVRDAKSYKRSYHVWRMMLKRCNDPEYKAHHNYGGRGITVCERWHSYVNFVADMGEPPLKHDLERKDNSRGYSPDNCGWRTRQRNCNNRRVNVHVVIGNTTYTVSQAARRFGLSASTVAYRRKAGLPITSKVNHTKRVRGKFYSDGVQTLCITDWAKMWGLAHTTARAQIERLVASGGMTHAREPT